VSLAAQPVPTEGLAVRLLLADDHRMLRHGLRRSLEDHGIVVVGEADDGETAVDLARRLEPQVVLMDVTMPVLDGVEATRRLRREAPDVRVVMLTMHDDADVLSRALAAGAVGYLVKDCSISEVVDTVRAAAAGQTALSPELASSMLAHGERVISEREEEVLQLIADGLSLPEVAARLYISAKTVRNHLASAYQKLDARDRTQAVLRAVRMGIVHLD
jgi:DNA-binding NarL/FixJ family response regulator